jgi:hypothetical protein
MTTIQIKSKIRWTAADIDWLTETANQIEADGYVKVAAMLRKEIAKL